MILHRPNKIMAILYVHFEPFNVILAKIQEIETIKIHLGSIAKGTDQHDKEKTNVEIEEDFENDFASAATEKIESVF